MKKERQTDSWRHSKEEKKRTKINTTDEVTYGGKFLTQN